MFYFFALIDFLTRLVNPPDMSFPAGIQVSGEYKAALI